MMSELMQIRQPHLGRKIFALLLAIIVDGSQVENDRPIRGRYFSRFEMAVSPHDIGIFLAPWLEKNRHLARLDENFRWQFGDGPLDDRLRFGLELFPEGRGHGHQGACAAAVLPRLV